MPKYTFAPEDLRRGFTIARLVKPLSGDFVLKAGPRSLTVYSADRRRYVHAVIPAKSSDAEDGYLSDDYYLPSDRTALFDTELDQVLINISDKGLIIKAEGDGQTRQATVKKRSESARRTPMPNRQQVSGTSVKSSLFEDLLHQVSCSALVKDTKTDEDRKVNQVHFYPEECSATSNARSYATVATLDGLSLDLSVVSDDIPAMRTFCSKSVGTEVIIGQDKGHLFLGDSSSGSVIAFSRVSCSRPPLQIIHDDGYEIEIEIDRDQLSKGLTWSSMAVEGTSRLSVKASDGEIEFSSNGQELSRIPVVFLKGTELKADFPVTILANIIAYVGTKKALLKYRHKTAPYILEVCGGTSATDKVRSRHFVQSMKERK